MRRHTARRSPAILLALAVACCVQSAVAQGGALEFMENLGQWGGRFQYKAEAGNATFFLQPDGFTILQHHPDDFSRLMDMLHGGASSEPASTAKGAVTARAEGGGLGAPLPAEGLDIPIRTHAYRMSFVGADPSAKSQTTQPSGTVANYFLGNDPAGWKSGVKGWQEVTYRDVYPKIDLRYHTYNGRLKYDIIVHPGADLSRLSMRLEGAERMLVRDGSLVIPTNAGESRQLEPYSYQVVDGVKREVPCRYRVRGDRLTYEPAAYDRSEVLVIDPTLELGSFSGSRASNWGYTATPGPDGSLFAGGLVFGTGYPVTLGAYQTTFAGGAFDIGITRFSPRGDNVLYATYLGGNSDDFPHSLIADPQGNLVILGRTASQNFPRTATYGPLGSSDIFVAKLSSDGRSLMGSMVIGGSGIDGANIDPSSQPPPGTIVYNYGDNTRSEVVLDGSNNVYVATNTQSGDLPSLASTLPRGGRQDALVLKLSPDLGAVRFCAYLGGSSDDAGFAIKVNPLNGEVYVAGATMSANLPGTKPTPSNTGHVIKTTFQGEADGYVAVFSNDGTSLLRSAYLGTTALDIIYGLQFDEKGFPYVSGITRGDWTVHNAAFNNPGSKQFISKLQPDLSGFVYSTVFGTRALVPNISPVAFLVDKCENVYVSGWGGPLYPCLSNSFQNRLAGTFGMPVTPDALYAQTDNSDFYIMVLEKDATRQLYGTFLGQLGGSGDHVDGGTSRFDSRGAIYQAICANCGGSSVCPNRPITRPLPITPGAAEPFNRALNSNKNGSCNLFAFKIRLDFSAVEAGLQPSINGVPYDTIGCLPLTVVFTDTLNALSPTAVYTWDFGDGTPPLSTGDKPTATHTFTRVGNFLVKLTVTDNSKCFPTATSFVNIIVRDDPASLAFSSVKQPPCSALTYDFVNNSSAPPGKSFSANSFTWDFGDGSPKVTTGTATVRHTFASPGAYVVRLTMNDAVFCNEGDYLVETLRISPQVQADFLLSDTVCAPYLSRIVNQSSGGVTFNWEFSVDGSTFTGFKPPDKNYTVPGTYTVKLRVEDPNTCNLFDDTTRTIVVGPTPTAAFTFAPPNPGRDNTPTQFTNRSVGANQYKWTFGDGDSTSLANPVHQYVSAGTFDACLVAINDFGCSNSFCDTVQSRVTPLADVPNAFSPNMDGKNDVIYVRGYGIARMNWRIYNRWGILVFQSTDPDQGWDGYYKGRIQPMDAYAYTLDIQFSDGTVVTRKGDITLLR